MTGPELAVLRQFAIKKERGFMAAWSPSIGNPFADYWEWDYFYQAPSVWGRHLVTPPAEAVSLTFAPAAAPTAAAEAAPTQRAARREAGSAAGVAADAGAGSVAATGATAAAEQPPLTGGTAATAAAAAAADDSGAELAIEQAAAGEALVIDEPTFAAFAASFVQLLSRASVAPGAAAPRDGWRLVTAAAAPSSGASPAAADAADAVASAGSVASTSGRSADSSAAGRQRFARDIRMRRAPAVAAVRRPRDTPAADKTQTLVSELQFVAAGAAGGAAGGTAQPNAAAAAAAEAQSANAQADDTTGRTVRVSLTQAHVESLVSILEDAMQQVPGRIKLPSGRAASSTPAGPFQELGAAAAAFLGRAARLCAIAVAVGLPLAAMVRPWKGDGKLAAPDGFAAGGGASIATVAHAKDASGPRPDIGRASTLLQQQSAPSGAASTAGAPAGASAAAARSAAAAQPVNDRLSAEQLARLCDCVKSLVDCKIWVPASSVQVPASSPASLADAEGPLVYQVLVSAVDGAVYGCRPLSAAALAQNPNLPLAAALRDAAAQRAQAKHLDAMQPGAQRKAGRVPRDSPLGCAAANCLQ